MGPADTRSGASSNSSTHALPSLTKPLAQVKAHEPAEHVAAPFVGAGHFLHDGPHDDALSATHSPEQEWNPELHAVPHLPPLHVAVPFFGTGHFASHPPQCSSSVDVSTHDRPHWLVSEGHRSAQPFAVHTCVDAHLVSQVRQWSGSVVSFVSQL
jgi:hypothetical protein